jgi:hypothetical protein
MASNIDATQPPAITPTTAAMRANMAAAKAEILALQSQLFIFPKVAIPSGSLQAGNRIIDFTTLYDVFDNVQSDTQFPHYDVIAICNLHWRVLASGTTGEHEGAVSSHLNSNFDLAGLYHQMLFDTYVETTGPANGAIMHEKHSLFLMPVHWTGSANQGYMQIQVISKNGAPVGDIACMGYIKPGTLA